MTTKDNIVNKQHIDFTEEGINEASLLIREKENEKYDITLPFKLKCLKDEIIYLLSSVAPIVLSTLIQLGIPMCNIYAMGQFGPVEISGVALGSIFANTTGNSFSLGMATALDTLCSQAFTGAKDKRQVGLHLQKGILIQMLLLIPVFILWWYSETALLFLKQDAVVSKLASQYLRVLIIGIPPFVLFECLKKYLQAQKIMRAQTWVLVFTVPITVFANYMLMWNPYTSIGFLGAACTLVIANWTMFIFMLGYIYFVEGLECWGGWSKECLNNWGTYLQLGSSGILMLCSEWWAWSIISLTVGYIGPEALAAHFISLNIDQTFYSFSISMGIVASNRIGNLLGAKHINRAKLAGSCSIFLSILIPGINSAFLSIFRVQIASIFTHDPKLNDILLTLIPMICFYHVFDSVACCSSGILRGQGRQKVGAIVNLISWYCIAIPIGIFISFYLGYGLQGMWIGVCFALFGTGSSLSYLTLKVDWNQLVLDAEKRLNAIP